MKLVGKIILAIALLGFSLFAQSAEVLTPVQIKAGWLMDDNHSLSITEVAAKPAADFATISHEGISFGFVNKAIWLRLELKNQNAKVITGWLDLGTPRFSLVKLYQTDNNQNAWRVLKSGLSVPIKQRALANRGLVFPIQLIANEKRIVYLAIRSNLAITVHLRWWRSNTYLERQKKQQLFELVLFGATLGLGIFGFLHALATLDILLALNGLRALVVVCWVSILLGYASFYGWSDSPYFLLPTANILTVLFLALHLLFLILFFPPHLYSAKIRYLFCSLATLATVTALCFSMALSHFASQLLKMVLFLGALNQLIVLYTCFIVAKRGFYPAWWLLVAFSFPIFGAYRKLLEAYISIPPSDFADLMVLVNTFITTVFIYLGTASRVDKLRKEREQALEANMRLQNESKARLNEKVKQRTIELETARDEANRANKAKTLFLAKVSHELRSPLHTILSYADLAKRHHKLDYIDTIFDAGQHLLYLIDDLLAYVKNTHAELTIHRQATYTNRLIEPLQAYGKTLAMEAGNEFLLNYDANLPDCIEIDSHRLIQIGIALLSNAATHTQHGKITLSLSRHNNTQLQLQVQDTGTGIAKKNLNRIFQPFERIATNNRKGSLGLGLAIARQLAKAMRGELTVNSTIGQGSLFTLCLPLILADPSQIIPFDGQHSIIGYQEPMRRILIVDDTVEHLHFMREFLESVGFEVTAVETVKTALLYAGTETHCDLVLLDFHLADITADKMLPQLRRQTAWDKVPVILISASPPRESQSFAAVVSKPVNQAKILSTIGQVLNLVWVDNSVADRLIKSTKYTDYNAIDWEKALDTGDIFAIETYIKQLANYNPKLAEQAQQLLKHYDFSAIRQQVVVKL